MRGRWWGLKVSGALTPFFDGRPDGGSVARGRGHRAIVMFDVKDDAKGEYRRVEVLVGPGRRRCWSAAEKARIVEESLVPGARVSEVARRWQVCSQQVFGWRRAACRKTTVAVKSTETATAAFVPITTDVPLPASVARAASATPAIEVELAGAVVRVVPGMDDTTQLTAVLRAIRASASPR
jgi:transposase